MSASKDSSRVKFAFRSSTWSYEDGLPADLKANAARVTPAEYETSMDGQLFCPGCFTNVYRTPKDKLFFANGRKACFSHLERYRHIPCDLRAHKPEGKRYDSEEEAKQAIADTTLVIVSGFQTTPPSTQGSAAGSYDQSAVEDIDGPLVDFPIGRHHGEQFTLPTKLSTVRSICRNFDANLYRYYAFPGFSTAVRLVDALVDIASVEEEDDVPRLYFGRIQHSKNAGRTSSNTRMTWLKHSSSVHDFCIKDTDGAQAEKGITDNSAGRIVLVWGRITVNGIGLCLTNLGWGEYALLPEKYNDLLV